MKLVHRHSRARDGTVTESVTLSSAGRKGDARTAAEKFADRAKSAQVSGRRFSLTGAWAGSDWICNCVGALRHGDVARCGHCGLRRPGMHHWMAQSLRWGPVAVADHVAAARRYFHQCLVSGVFQRGKPGTEGVDEATYYAALYEQVARDFHIMPSVLD